MGVSIDESRDQYVIWQDFDVRGINSRFMHLIGRLYLAYLTVSYDDTVVLQDDAGRDDWNHPAGFDNEVGTSRLVHSGICRNSVTGWEGAACYNSNL